MSYQDNRGERRDQNVMRHVHSTYQSICDVFKTERLGRSFAVWSFRAACCFVAKENHLRSCVNKIVAIVYFIKNRPLQVTIARRNTVKLVERLFQRLARKTLGVEC